MVEAPFVGTAVLTPSAGYLLLAVFGGAWISLELWWGRRVKSYDGFAVAGRNVGLTLASATAVATWITIRIEPIPPDRHEECCSSS